MSTPYFEQLLAAKTGTALPALPGRVLAAVNKQGEQIYFKCAGRDTVISDSPQIQADAMFWLVACTKLIRNVTALQCVKRGQICLNNPVDEILPELARPQITQAVVSSDDGGAASQGFSLVSAKSTITLRQLLTHTSGLGYDFVYLELMAWRASRGEEPLSLSGQLVKAYSTPLLFEPGEGWAYGGGINWAGELVARLNKTTLEEYMREHILKPLGMNSTSYRLELRPDITMPLVETAQREDDGILQSSQKAWPDHAPEDCAGAGFYSSVPDYLKVLGDLIKDTPTLLSREIIEREMFAPQLWRDSLALRSLLSAPDLVSSMTGSTESGTGINHGLGGLYFGADIGNVKKGTLTWGWIAQSKVVQKLSRKGHCAVCYSADAPGDPVCAQVTRAFFDEVWRLTTR